MRPTAERLWGKVDKNGPIPKHRPELGPCWVWRATIDRGGYGSFWNRNRMDIAHRVAYELSVGPIPDGLEVDHLCRNRACVRPSHLEVVTPRENMLRGQSIPASNALKTHCKRGHPLTLANTYDSERRAGRRKCKTCARTQAWKEGGEIDQMRESTPAEPSGESEVSVSSENDSPAPESEPEQSSLGVEATQSKPKRRRSKAQKATEPKTR